MNKQELLSQLDNAQNNFMLGIAALGLLMQDENHPVLENLICILTNSSVSFVSSISEVQHQFKDAEFPVSVSPFPLAEAAKYLKNADETQRQNIQKEFFKMLLRVHLRESFEVIKDYCEASNQANLFKQQDWYDYLRIVRNCFSHNFLIQYNNKDKQSLPICWNGRSLTIQMDGQPLTASILGVDGMFELHKEMRSFVINSL